MRLNRCNRVSPDSTKIGWDPISPTPISPTPISPTPISPTTISPTPISPTPIQLKVRVFDPATYPDREHENLGKC